MHVFVLSCKFLMSKHKNMRVSMYFLHLELTFTPHYIIVVKGLLLLSLENHGVHKVRIQVIGICIHISARTKQAM